MTYFVNDVFYTLQGEGFWSGRAAVFCRFSRCNLWTGLEKDRHRAVCKFCDTDFVTGTKYEKADLLAEIRSKWTGGPKPMVVFTGGEPLLQLDRELTFDLHQNGWYVAVETNGTIPISGGVDGQLDWVCVSPKINAELVIHKGDELKLVYPQGPDPGVYLGLKFDHFWLSPMDGDDLAANTAAAVDYVLAHPQWRLNTQTHKVIGIP